jgi:hypothetical protein
MQPPHAFGQKENLRPEYPGSGAGDYQFSLALRANQMLIAADLL